MARPRVLPLLVLVTGACLHREIPDGDLRPMEAPADEGEKPKEDAPERKNESASASTPIVTADPQSTAEATAYLPSEEGAVAQSPAPHALLSLLGTRGAGTGSDGLAQDLVNSPSGSGVGWGASGPQRSGKLQAAPGDVAVAAPPPVVPPPVQGTESYDGVTDNRFQTVSLEPLSTFSIDVDTAAYANSRRFLKEGTLPPKDAVRIEEFVNSFQYDYPGPEGNRPFTVITEVGSCPWAPDHRLVHIGLQGKRLAQREIPPRNLVFLVDVSGSMDSPDRLPLVKAGLRDLVGQLRGEDHVAIVVYAGSSGLVLPPTSGADKLAILGAIDRLQAGGSTAGGEGIELAYATARTHFQAGAVNRVILATDGDFNVGVTSQGDLVRLIEEKRESGVFLTVLGYGRGNLKDSMMEKLADKGNGHYAYIDSLDESKKALSTEAGASLVTIAKDVKIQVEWNPAQVAGYRLIGYENRVLAAQDFHDDKKDAGEIGAGHSVTALYEVVPAGMAVPGARVDALKYQQQSLTAQAGSAEMMTVKLRYKAPDARESQLLSFPLIDRGMAWANTSEDFRWSAAVASFGMILRDSEAKGSSTWSLVRTLAKGALGRDADGSRHEFLSLVDRASELSAERVGVEVTQNLRVVR